MPELPEVETVRRGLEPHLVGRRILDVEVTGARTTRRTSPDAIRRGLQDCVVTGLDRRGKYLVMMLHGPGTPPGPDIATELGWRTPDSTHPGADRAAMVHLRMSGQLLLARQGDPTAPHTHVRLRLDAPPPPDGDTEHYDELRFVDPRTFGEVVVASRGTLAELLPELNRLGPDPVAEPELFTRAMLSRALRSRRRRVKTLLMDQYLVAGIGNIYSDEILHRARIRPTRLGIDMSSRQVARIHEATLDILPAAIAAGGSSLRDAQYVDAQGLVGRYQDQHRVVERAGTRCRTCERGWITSERVDGRTSSWCPWCQR